ncbi:MAG TPA: biopolymer transporter ExbD [Opitutales bacterium]|nr:biopolymer transporter ExbD [Opitutales bacterium]
MKSLVRKRRQPEINMVPLIDVLTILIFFFLMTMQYREVMTLNLVLPQIETAGKSEISRALTIGIDQSGNFSLDGRKIEREELPGLLQPLKPVAADVSVLIMADEKTPLLEVTYAMDQCRQAGLESIRLQSR